MKMAYWPPREPGSQRRPDGFVETGTGLITADFSGFFFSWAGTDFLAGGTATGQPSPISVNAMAPGNLRFS